MKRSHLILLLLLLCLFSSCSAGSQSQSPATSTAKPQSTPSPAITPTPTIPAVPSQKVHFQTADNIQLAGLLYGNGKIAVICSHEFRADKSIWDESGIPQRLAQRGYRVLAYDFRGNGDSAGKSDVSKLDVDLRAAVGFMRQQGASTIVLLGSSMGGTASLQVAASEQIAAVLTLSAPQSFGKGISDAQIKSISVPKLFINSENDDYASETQHMYSLASEPKELHLYPGFAHGVNIFMENGSDLTLRLLTFIEHYAPVG
ncbi:alpha/beta hydrolase [Ktedonosporobacter rubrisoli]|nr:alpha/beta hydrolase [Ktedonosporobacter rubrisoli]